MTSEPKAVTDAGLRLRARARLERLRIELGRRRLRAAESRAAKAEVRVEKIRRRRKDAGRERLPKIKLKKAQRARARLHGPFATWEDLVMSVGNREALRLLLDAGILGRALPQLSEPPVGERLLVLVPHQDDEGIGAAGTLLLADRRGCQIRIVYYTDGATSLGRIDPGDVARLRAHEARSAWSGTTGVQLDFIGVPTGEEVVPDSAVDRLEAIVADFEPTSIFLPTFLEEPYEHRLLTQWLLGVEQRRPFRADTEVWGYQVTTRLPGNAVVDITDVRDEKYQLNRSWGSQNALLDYAELAAGQDAANALFLSKAGATLRDGAGHGEMFIRFDAPRYLSLARSFLALEERVGASLEQGAEKGRRTPGAGAVDVPPPDFFVVGLQKSGTYWVSGLLNGHPEVRCFPSLPAGRDGTGEAHLFDVLARMETDYQRFRKSMSSKLGGFFKDLLPPEPPEDEFARGQLAQRLADHFARFCELERRRHHKPVVGEKTTETVHHLDILERLFPGVRKVAILRDPRDRAISFHYHQQRKGRRPERAINSEQVDKYVNRARQDYEGLLEMREPWHVLTYEQLTRDPFAALPPLLEFLEVDSSPAVVHRMVDSASFSSLTGRSSGEEDASSHYRKGVVGDWRRELPRDDAARMVAELEPLTARVEERFSLDLADYRTQ